MKIQLVIDVDTISGEYELTYHQKKKLPIDASELMEILERVLTKVSCQLGKKIEKTRD